jgi:cytochrome P450
MREDGPGFLLRLMREHGDLARFRLAQLECYLASHPDLVRSVLQDDAKRYTKVSRGYEILRRFLGDGLLTSEGERWTRQRKIAQPAFARERMQQFAPVMTAAAEARVAAWSKLPSNGDVLDVADEMTATALEIAGRAFMSTDVSGQADRVRKALAFLSEDTMRRIHMPLEPPLSWPTENNRRYEEAVRDIDAVVYELVGRRRRGESQGYDLLAMLMEARDESSGDWMSDRQLRDEIMTLFTAGHETTANALSWTWYCLSLAPEAERRLHAEVDGLRKAPAFGDVAKLPVTNAVVREAMRLFPPAWILARTALEDLVLGGYHVRRGSVVFVSPYATHRHPAFWAHPDAFDEDRFAPAVLEKVSRYAYIPFGAGPRICLGMQFALTEMVLVVATIARKFRLVLAPEHRVEVHPAVTLRPRHGMKMRLERRG